MVVEHSFERVVKFLPEISQELGWEYRFKPQKNSGLSIILSCGDDRYITSKVLVFMNKLQPIIKQ